MPPPVTVDWEFLPFLCEITLFLFLGRETIVFLVIRDLMAEKVLNISGERMRKTSSFPWDNEGRRRNEDDFKRWAHFV